MLKKEFFIPFERGIHARTAALLTGEANSLEKHYDIKLFIEKDDISVPMTSMLAITSLDINYNEKVMLKAEGDLAELGLNRIEEILNSKFEEKLSDNELLDIILEENSMTSDQIIDSLSDGVIYLNSDNVVVLINPAAETILGRKAIYMMGKKPSEIFGSSAFSDILSNNETIREERIDLGTNVILFDKTIIISRNNIMGKAVILKDITNLENLSIQLKYISELKDKFGSILDHISDGICLLDVNGYINYVNDSFCQMWGISVFEAMDKRIDEITLENTLIKRILSRNEFETYVITKSKDRQIVIYQQAIYINKEFAGIVASFRENTDQKKMIELLDNAEKELNTLKKQFEIKNIIDSSFNTIIGESRVLTDALSIASKVSKTSASVLIMGESGTGKELVAKAIHYSSPRKSNSFIKVNCAAIPENLLESELFGYEKGAFTGADKQKLGKFEIADGGSLFLDEIGEISFNVQSKLLRVLQEKEIDRVGGKFPIGVDVRIIAATNKDLKQMVKDGKFREDLYYRLNVIPVELPPLRDRVGDMPMLVEFFLKKICENENIEVKKITSIALEYLEKYNWPGNIRELENTLIRSVILSDGQYIDENTFPSYIIGKEAVKSTSLINLTDGNLASLEDYDREIIRIALEKYKTFNKAAKALGITHRTVSLKAKKYGIIE